MNALRRVLFSSTAVHPLIAATHGPYWAADCFADAARTAILKGRLATNAAKLQALTEQAEAIVHGDQA